MNKITSTSLVISTYNWPDALNLCLESIISQSVLPDEVIIADDGSGTQTKALIQRWQEKFPVPLLHVWHEDKGFRKTVILNRAIKDASGEYIIQIDGDVILHRKFIEDHILLAEQGCFVRGSRGMLTAEKTKQIISQSQKPSLSFWSSGILNRMNVFHSKMLAVIIAKKSLSSKSVRGSNLAFWKKDFEMVNGYNNNLLGWGHEDEELATRFTNKGIYKKVVKMAAVQYHLHHKEVCKKSEAIHADFVLKIRRINTIYCANGLNQI